MVLATHSKSLREMASVENCDAIFVRASQVAGTTGIWKPEPPNLWQLYFTTPTQQFGDGPYTCSYMPHSWTEMAWIITQQTRKKLTTSMSAK